MSAVADVGSELRLAVAYLSRVAEPASLPLWLLVAELGYVEAAAAVRLGEVPPEVASATEARRGTVDAEADLDAAVRNDIRLVTPLDPDWPHFAFASLRSVAERRAVLWRAGYTDRPARGELLPPLALWVRGTADLSLVGTRSIAVVGARSATAYGEHIAADFSYGLARQEVVVVSGGAYGIDAAAHRGALAADGESVLVSAGGLDRPYPAGHRTLYDRIAENGLLVSEHPPGSAPHRQRFLSRNRLIAALGSALLVVEAGARSGALNSAGHARDLGRPVLAVPGPVTSAMSVGCHRLIRRDEDPARLVSSVAEVLPYCGLMTSQPLAVADQLTAVSARDCLDDRARSVLDGFPSRAAVAETQLAQLSGQPVSVVRSVLPVLLNLGLVEPAPPGYRLTHSAAAR